MEACDETYIVAPLAKLFVGTSLEDINSALGFDGEQNLPGKERYKELEISDAKAATVKLVSTYRTKEQAVLFRHAMNVKGCIGWVSSDGQTNVHHLYPFDHPDGLSPNQERDIEFPHHETWDPRFTRRFFGYGSE